MATLHTPINGAATQIYTPAASGTPKVTFVNEGTSIAWIGGATVQAGSGFPLPPGQSITLPVAYQTLYAISSFNATATATTLSAAALNSGATTVTVISGAGIANGNQIQIGAQGGSRTETVTVTAGGGTTTLTVSPATSFDHRLSDTVTLVTPIPTTIHTESATG